MPESPRILLVEDDIEQQKLYAQILTRAGYAITTANSAEAAIDLLHTAPFHLLLTDWYLPAMNGPELIALVREQYPAVITVLMSTHQDVGRTADDCAADACFHKGDLARLRTVLATLLPRS